MASEDQLAARVTGKVNWFNNSKGYGFITPGDGGEELFVHQSSIVSEGYRTLTVGDLVEFSITKGSDGKTKAVDVTAPGGGPIKKDNNSRGNGTRRGGGGDGCFTCGELGHIAKECRGGGERRSGREGCYTCGDIGHFARDCVEKLGGNGYQRGSGGGGREGCYNCGEIGHFARDCTEKLAVGNVGGERSGGSCYSCGGVGHKARDCATTKRQSSSGACYQCGGSGHLARDCNRRGGSRGGGNTCFHCGEEGHFARDCSVA